MKELLQRADATLLLIGLDPNIKGDKAEVLSKLIKDLSTALRKREWQLISTKDCGCEIRQSNKGNYFVDSCAECTPFPSIPEVEND